MLVARWHGKIAGAVRGRSQGDVVEIGRLVVHPRFQRNGIGTRLLRAIEMHFATEACYELFTGDRSMGNLRLYARHGYTEIRREGTASTVTVVVMRKRRP